LCQVLNLWKLEARRTAARQASWNRGTARRPGVDCRNNGMLYGGATTRLAAVAATPCSLPHPSARDRRRGLCRRTAVACVSDPDPADPCYRHRAGTVALSGRISALGGGVSACSAHRLRRGSFFVVWAG